MIWTYTASYVICILDQGLEIHKIGHGHGTHGWLQNHIGKWYNMTLYYYMVDKFILNWTKIKLIIRISK